MPDVTTEDDVTIHYQTIGEGERDAVFVHGWMVSSGVWEGLLEALDLSEHRLIVPDLRGAGQSEPADTYEIADYAGDVLAVADDAGADPFDLIGHSMGGQIAQMVAAEAGERVERLALLCPVPASGMELPEEAHQLFLHSGGDREKQSIILDQACLDLADADKERLLDDAGAIPADCIKASFEAWTGTDFSDRLCDITAETLVVGSDDPFLPPEFLDQAVVQPIADARFTHIPEAGHYVQVERTSQTKDALEDFLG